MSSSHPSAVTLRDTARPIARSPQRKPLAALDEVPIPEALSRLSTIRLFTWNLWHGGSQVHDGRAKQVDVVGPENADIVFLQECFGDASAQLGRSLGMTTAQQGFDNAVLSGAPIRRVATDTDRYATAAIVQTAIGDVLAWSVHLEYQEYGPYRQSELPDAAEDIFAQESERERTRQAEKVLAETDRILGAEGPMPVIVAGDFNVPSPTDWDGEIRPVAAWPATSRFLDAGYTDAFRHAHPDVSAAPGLSWSQIETLETEPRDRIDFIFVKGLEVIDADQLGQAADDNDAPADEGLTVYPGPCAHIPNQRGNSFPSDHLAVRAIVQKP